MAETAMDEALAFLDATNPVFDAWSEEWARFERLGRGGVHVKNELRRFDWETVAGEQQEMGAFDRALELVRPVDPAIPFAKPGQHYAMRQGQAVYVNFPEMFATSVVGQVFRKAPTPDFGTMGKIERRAGATDPSYAELVWYNADGIGNDGSQWANYWQTSMKRAAYTGHRWHLAEASSVPAVTDADVVRRGKRPYLVELSPTRVHNWEYDKGQLQFAVIRRQSRRLRRGGDGTLERQSRPDYLLLVREGYDLFDDVKMGLEFSTGGWFLFDDEKNLLDAGDWTKTGGEIPLWSLYWERDDGTDLMPSMSRPATMEIGNAAVAYMNLSSAANFELWDGAKGLEWLRGVDQDGWELAMEKISAGSRYVPLAVNQETQTPLVPEVGSSNSTPTVTAAFNERMVHIRAEVRELMSMEASGTAESSGESKKAGFADTKAPRLALIASEVEQAQNTAIHFLELRFGAAKATGSVQWPREFDLAEVETQIERFLNAEKTVGVKNKRLDAVALTNMAIRAGLAKEDDRETVQAEYEKSADEAQAQATSEQRTLERIGLAGAGAAAEKEPAAEAA